MHPRIHRRGGRPFALRDRLIPVFCLQAIRTQAAALVATLVLAACAAQGDKSPLSGRPLVPMASTLRCADLAGRDFSTAAGFSARVATAEEVGSGPSAYCSVKGLITGSINYEVRLPSSGWTQRFLMVGCGGYCGSVREPASLGRQTAGCVPIETNQMVTAASDLGHQSTGAAGAWARGNPTAVIDFAYAGMHKTVVLAKAITHAFYGKGPSYSYYVGCSDGGREGLHEAQRFPDDFDGIVAGAPTIDEVATNTFYHAWNVRVNSGAGSLPVLSADKMPALAAAVKAACGDAGGLVQDARACRFSAAQLQCPANVDRPDCLTEAQVEVVEKLWSGPVDEFGRAMSAGNMPKGSELNWLGAMVPRAGRVALSYTTSSDFAYSYDFPNYMAAFGEPTGITNANMQFTRAGFEQLMKLQALWDPTNPDLSTFAARGGKLLIWHGWEDAGVSPLITLNYYDAVKRQMGAERASQFLTLYMLPGVGHCNAGANTTYEDFLTPMMEWVEHGRNPDRVDVEFRAGPTGKSVLRTRPTFPYPSAVRHVGGDLNAANSFERTALPPGLSDSFEWIGLSNYRSGVQMYCSVVDGAPRCSTR